MYTGRDNIKSELSTSLLIKAVLFLFASFLCFDVMSVLVRVMLSTGHYSAQELSAYRNVFGIIPSLLLMVYSGELRLRGSSLKIEKTRLALFRGVVVAIAQLCFYYSIASLELATVSALGQTNALFVVLLSVLLLGERVGKWRISALILGFAGAVWILRPGSDTFSAAALLPIIAAACYAFSMVSVRHFGPQTSNSLLYLYSSAGAAVGAILIAAATSEFHPLRGWADAGIILFMSMIGGVGVLFISLSYRSAPPSLLAPFGYFAILSAFLFGWVFFGEAPVDSLFPGVLLVIGAGALIMWRENRLSRSV